MGYRSKNAILLVSAPHGSPDVNVDAGLATGTGAAHPPGVTIPGSGQAVKALVIQSRDLHPGWRAAGFANLLGAPVDTDVFVGAGPAAGVGTANPASVTTPGGTSAAAGRATGTGTAYPTTITTSGGTNAAAGNASATGVANPATVVAPNATAGRATGTGAAYQPVVTTPSSANATAGRATGVGAALGPSGSSAGVFTHVTVTRDYDLGDGSAPTGTVYFTPSDWLVNNGVTVPAAPVAAPLNVAGAISIDLVANTDSATAPAGSYYTVREEIFGQPSRSYRVRVPHDQGSAIDLSTLPVLT